MEADIRSGSSMEKKTNPYVSHCYPIENIRHAVWLYFLFTLSFRT